LGVQTPSWLQAYSTLQQPAQCNGT
jgi:hypothetical protein